jgi:hypothetical protein
MNNGRFVDCNNGDVDFSGCREFKNYFYQSKNIAQKVLEGLFRNILIKFVPVAGTVSETYEHKKYILDTIRRVLGDGKNPAIVDEIYNDELNNVDAPLGNIPLGNSPGNLLLKNSPLGNSPLGNPLLGNSPFVNPPLGNPQLRNSPVGNP